MERMNPTGKLTPFLTVLFFEGLSLSLVYPAMPTLIFSLSESKAQGIAFCTINLFLFPLVFILSSVLASVALDESGRRPLLLSRVIHNSIGLLLLINPHSLFQVIVGRLLSGYSQASTSIVQAVASDLSSIEERPQYFGLINSVIALSFIAGLLISGSISYAMGSYRLLFQIALLSSLIGLLLSLLRCPETYPSLQQQRVTANGLSGFRSRLRCHLSDISSLLTRGTRVLFILLFCFTTTNLGIFAFWALYAEYHFHWTISQISASLLLMTIVTATSQRFVLPTLLPRVGSIRLLQIMLLSTIIYPLLLGIANQVAFAMLPLFNIIGFSGSSLIQGELSRQQDQDRQGLVASQFGVITGAGTLVSVTLSGLLAWLVNSLGMANGPLSGSPFFVLSVLPIACWWYVKGDINEAFSSTSEG